MVGNPSVTYAGNRWLIYHTKSL